jgi:hypothetical protein
MRQIKNEALMLDKPDSDQLSDDRIAGKRLINARWRAIIEFSHAGQ